jgi:homocysteine S-methyltransferase
LEGLQLNETTESTPEHETFLRGIQVLDGGMASELEYLGANIDGPLWSAHVLEDSPGKILAVHRAYIAAGAQCIETASYQVSRMGYAEFGLSPERADAALLRSVELARTAVAELPEKRILVGVSLGPYGAALHNGAEYHGNYACTHAELVAFHAARIEVISEIKEREALAFETLPSLEEARAIGEALAPYPNLAAWFTFTCKDEKHVAHGELLRECAAAVAAFPQTVAIGVNCTHPSLIASLIGELRAANAHSPKPIVVYPNAGEDWDAAARCWTGSSDPAAYGARAAEWFAAGAQIVGGCCRTRPAHISEVARAAAQAPPDLVPAP